MTRVELLQLLLGHNFKQLCSRCDIVFLQGQVRSIQVLLTPTLQDMCAQLDHRVGGSCPAAVVACSTFCLHHHVVIYRYRQQGSTARCISRESCFACSETEQVVLRPSLTTVAIGVALAACAQEYTDPEAIQPSFGWSPQSYSRMTGGTEQYHAKLDQWRDETRRGAVLHVYLFLVYKTLMLC